MSPCRCGCACTRPAEVVCDCCAAGICLRADADTPRRGRKPAPVQAVVLAAPESAPVVAAAPKPARGVVLPLSAETVARMGGLAVVARHGTAYMAELGRRSAAKRRQELSEAGLRLWGLRMRSLRGRAPAERERRRRTWGQSA